MKTSRWLIIVVTIIVIFPLPLLTLAGETTWVSVDSTGVQGNEISYGPAISSTGRYVAFDSEAANLVPDDTNGYEDDVFVHDRKTGQTTMVSVDSNGVQGKGGSAGPAISSTGRYVAFWSFASNLVPDDTNDTSDVFVHDRKTGQTTMVSVDSNGVQGNGFSFDPAISSTGRYVAFSSHATNLVPEDTNGEADIFVHDRKTEQTTRVSVDSNGVQGNDFCAAPAISSTGRYVAFTSWATNLVPDDDTNDEGDVFVHDYRGGGRR